jgi:hypothetical protein
MRTLPALVPAASAALVATALLVGPASAAPVQQGSIDLTVGYTSPSGCPVLYGDGTSSTAPVYDGPTAHGSAGPVTIVEHGTTTADIVTLTGSTKGSAKISVNGSGSTTAFGVTAGGSARTYSAIGSSTTCGGAQIGTQSETAFGFHVAKKGTLTVKVKVTGSGRIYRQAEVYGNGFTWDTHGSSKVTKTYTLHLPKAGDYDFFGNWEAIAFPSKKGSPANSSVNASVTASFKPAS